MGRKNWEIIHIPDKPPFLPTQQPTVEALASVIDPKLTHSLVRKLNQLAPSENLRHVKRVRKSCSNGQTQLSVILSFAREDDRDFSSIPEELRELINRYELSPFVTKVCKYAATTKEEWEEQCKLWPTSFHPPTYNIDGITGFSEEDSHVVFSNVNLALELAKSVSSQLVNAAVIVDPSANQIIARGCDEIYTSRNFLDGNGNEEYSLDHDKASTSNDVVKRSLMSTLSLNGSRDHSQSSDNAVACLNPWQWSQLHPSSPRCCFWHPLRHAAMVAIENSAARDRHLFPSAEEPVQVDPTEPSIAKKPKTSDSNGKICQTPDGDSFSKSDKPYLCTGYDIYLTWEPCAMCAMALVHQRFRRIFYAFPNTTAGALGSVHRLQGEKSLNHHYAVFRVIVDDEALSRVEESICSQK